MSDHVNDGGPAFPRITFFPAVPPDNPTMEGLRVKSITTPDPGMSLRDWFAGQALVGILAYSPSMIDRQLSPNNAADDAYLFADAMLAASHRSPKGGDQ